MESMQILTLLSTGFVLGLHHALDADHVAAVTTIVARTGRLRSSALFGAIWGAGHTTTLFLTGLLLLIFKVAIPQRLALFFEGIVGAMLIVMGIGALYSVYGAINKQPHSHTHEHDTIKHSHTHRHNALFSANHHKSFVVGLVHGLAGSAALMLLVLSMVQSVVNGLIFIIIFGIGSILGMLLTSTLIGLPFVFTTRFEKAHALLSVLSGVASMYIGTSIIYEIIAL